MLTLLLRTIDALGYVGAAGAALACAALAVMLVVEVIATSFLAWSQPWAVEYASYFLALTLFLGSAWALRTGGHIRVSALLALVPPRVARLIDLAGSIFALGVIGWVAVALVSQALRTLELGSVSYYPSRTPLVYPQALLALGFVLLALAFLARVLRLAVGLAPEAPFTPPVSGNGPPDAFEGRSEP